MAKTERPNPSASEEEWARWFAEHGATIVREHIQLDWRINVLALAAVCITIFGSIVAASKWAGSVDTKLDALTQIAADNRARDGQLAQLSQQMAVLQATSQENNTALLGPNSVSNRRARAR